ncbi:MAG TPA: MBOAT family O-acyltransferase [Pyrinomonadaceae bacterium]|jgi:D-alanyl-lipoteichoic acid acyltransferase DltB (MBOAT superfamily)
MIFNSFTFIIFFAVVLSLYYAPLSWRTHKIILLIASYVFYGAWNPPFLLLLWFSTMVDWLCALWMERSETQRRRRIFLIVSLACNLGMLSYFKYGNFFLENFIAGVNAVGLSYRPAAPSIILPVGISFYTFQSLSYTIDVYRKHIPAKRSLLDFALFVSFFPQLVAGPIVRAVDFLPQLLERKRATSNELGWGMTLLCVGLFEKVVMADTILAPIADTVYASTDRVGFFSAWTGTLAFSLQIFFDFAGYSTCAIGVAMCFGFALMKNFNFPYAATGPQDFWVRWHMSLSTWFRDYVFTPLARLKRGRVSRRWLYLMTMVTMLLSGLWHGAAWKFVVWGGLHAVYLISERFIRERLARRRANQKLALAPITVAEGGFILLPRGAGTLLLVLLTYGLVCLSWVFFRAPDLSSALHVLRVMFTPVRGDLMRSIPDSLTVLAVTALTLIVSWRLRDEGLVGLAEKLPAWLRGVATAVIIFSVLACILSGDGGAFIYFQF